VLRNSFGGTLRLCYFSTIILSIGGIPPFAGFWNKYYLLSLFFYSGNFILLGLVLITSVVSVFTIIRIIKIFFFEELKSKYFIFLNLG